MKCCLLLALAWIGASPAWSDAPPAPPAMLLAEVYTGKVDVTQYWVSEKLDGVRAQWDGHVLRFRSGGIVPAPAWFTKPFPAVPMDGELWIGRGKFDALSATVRRSVPLNAEWWKVHYMIFELPAAPGTFSDRLTQMQTLVSHTAVPWLRVVRQTRVASRKVLKRKFEAIVFAGGEGLMLHRADAPYVTGRSDVLLKMKPWKDAEAVVVGYTPGKGKYRGKTGALVMQMPNGKRFRIGSGLTDALRRKPPPIGTRITYRYQYLTKKGVPRFPRYLHIWEDF